MMYTAPTIERWSNAIETRTKSGWVGLEGKPQCDTNPPYGWQLRMSINPTQANIKKAGKALAATLEKFSNNHNQRHPGMKLFLSPDTAGIPWDGTLAYTDQPDRDQRGKELCIYMETHRETFAFSPDELKELMLTIWKAMEDASIQISYITPPSDEAEIPTESGIVTPFCYSAFKPFRYPEVENGILLAQSPNPLNYSSPLRDVTITREDLRRHGIHHWQALDILSQRISYQTTHLQEATSSIKSDLDRLCADSSPQPEYQPLLTSLRALQQQSLTTDDEYAAYLQSFRTTILISPLLDKLPRLEDADLSRLVEVGEMAHYLDKNKDYSNAARVQGLQPLVNRLINGTELAINATAEKILQFVNLLPEPHFTRDQIHAAVTRNPVACQKIYRRLVLCQKENQSIQRATTRAAAQRLLDLMNYYLRGGFLGYKGNRHHLKEAQEIKRGLDGFLKGSGEIDTQQIILRSLERTASMKANGLFCRTLLAFSTQTGQPEIARRVLSLASYALTQYKSLPGFNKTIAEQAEQKLQSATPRRPSL